MVSVHRNPNIPQDSPSPLPSPSSLSSSSTSNPSTLPTVMDVKHTFNSDYSPTSNSLHSCHSPNASSLIYDTPDTPQTPYNPRYLSTCTPSSLSPTCFFTLSESTIDNEIFANTHQSSNTSSPFDNIRTSFLPTTCNFNFKLPSVPNSASSSNSINYLTYPSKDQLPTNRFSLSSIDTDKSNGINNYNYNYNYNYNINYNPITTNNYSIEHQLNNLSLDVTPSTTIVTGPVTNNNIATKCNILYSNNPNSSIPSSHSVVSCSTNPSTRSRKTNSLSTIPQNNSNLTKLQSLKENSISLSSSSSSPTSSPLSFEPENLNLDLSLLSANEIILLSKDQNGCRMLQQLIDDDVNKNLPLIFNATYKNSTSLMLDPFGNYLIQKLMVFSTVSQISLIIIDISPNIGKIATNLHGTRALQKLISCLTTPNHHDLIALAIAPVIVKLIHDLNGNHVIQKLISHFFGTDLEFLIDLIIINLYEIATHKHGCCVLQKLLIKCSNLQILKISNEILRKSVDLMQDQYGNYVIQYLISLKIDIINYELLNLVANELISLSCGKFSSNVVEKCLKLNPKGCAINGNIHPLLAAMINIQSLLILIKDQYGNYVVQTALEIADYPIKCVMAEMIRPVLGNIKNTNYGKKIHIKILQILTEMETNDDTNTLLINPPPTRALLPGINFSADN